MASEGPMDGLRVLDLSQHVAGPYCTKLLADYGAEVIKVEPPGSGDVSRRLGPFPGDVPDPEKSGLFLHLNTNKLGITLDIRTGSGLALAKELLSTADILVEDMGPGVLASLGLGPDVVRQVNPRAVTVSITGFGPVGPYRDYKATDLVLFAMSSWMEGMGPLEGPPLYPGGPYILYVAGQYATIGALLASEYAEWTGTGQTVRVSMLEAGISVQVYDTVAYSYFGRIRNREGHRWRGLTLSVQPCKDGYLNFCVGHGEERWQDLWTVMLQRPEVLGDPRFAVNERGQHQDELEAMVQEALRERTVEEVFHQGQALRLFFSPIPNLKEVLESPQHQARGYFQEVDHPRAGRLTYIGPPVRLTRTPWALRRPAPLLGQHNADVYGGRLSLSGEQIVALRAGGVI